MQRYVLRADDGPSPDERGACAAGAKTSGSVTLLLPETLGEYEQARAEVEAPTRPNVETKPAERPALVARLAEHIHGRPPGETKPADRTEDEGATPVGEGEAATAETPCGGYYVVTSDSQRRAWGLPDLVNETAAHDTTLGDVDTIERPDVVPVVDPTEAIDLLFEDSENESDGEDSDGGAIGARRYGRTHPAPMVNLKHDRGPIPDDVRAAFRELCGQPRVDSLLEATDALLEPLETAAVRELEDARRQLAALRQQEVTPDCLGDAGGADGSDETAERVARTCWLIRRRLRKVGETLGRLDFPGMEIAPTPSAFRRFLQRVGDDPAENMPEEGLVAVCDRALRALEQAAEQAVSRIRGVVDARREVEAGEWSDAAVGRIRLVLRRLEDAGKALDDGSLPNSVVEAVREGLKVLDEERHSGDPLAATTREVLGRIEAADLPLPVLTRALDEIRMSRPRAGRPPRCCSNGCGWWPTSPGPRGRVNGSTSRRQWRSWKRPTPAVRRSRRGSAGSWPRAG